MTSQRGQRLKSILSITGGVSPEFQKTITDGSRNIGDMSASLRDANTNARRISDTLQTGQLGRADIRLARQAMKELADATEDQRLTLGNLQRREEQGDFGASEIGNARREMARLEGEIRQGEIGLAEFNEEAEAGKVGVRTTKALTDEHQRLTNQIDDSSRALRQASKDAGGFESVLRRVGRGAFFGGIGAAAGVMACPHAGERCPVANDHQAQEG